MPRNDPRLSRFGNERVEELAEEQAGDVDLDVELTVSDYAILAGLFLAASPPGWAVIVAVWTDRTYAEAMIFLIRGGAEWVATGIDYATPSLTAPYPLVSTAVVGTLLLFLAAAGSDY